MSACWRHLAAVAALSFSIGLVAVAPAVASDPSDVGLAEIHDALKVAQQRLDYVWILIAAALVLLMQVGFMLLEAGMVRSKNSVNVAQKNMLDFTFSVLAFACVGFMISFGAGNGFWIGVDSKFFMLREVESWGLAFFVFQVMFCGTAATIVSGAVAERMPLIAYLLCSLLIAGLVYPVFVHWAWGAALVENSSAFLGNMGFVDFAGSTVVHGTGAWIALAACIVVGARKGRFDAAGRPVRIQGHSPVLATAGAFFIFVGWIGFNGGSTIAAVPDIAHIVANTVLAAATGGTAGFLVGWRQDGIFLPEKAISGMLGGLVAVTAGCMALGSQGAMLVGALGGLAAVYSNTILEARFKIDDAVGAVGVHGVAGVVGTLSVALFAPLEHLPTGARLDQLGVQALGSGVNFVWAFGVSYLFFVLLRSVMPIRVSAEDEERGLNETEHGTRLGIGHVEDAYSALINGETDLSLRLPVTQGDEAERLSGLFNRLMDSIQNEELARNFETEKQRSEEEAERLSALANSTFEAITISIGGIVADGNAALEELLGIPIDHLKGRKVLDLVDPQDHDLVRKRSRLKDSKPYELRVIHVDGTVIPVEVRSRQIVYRGKRTMVSAVVDLRDRKKAEQKIRHLAQHDPLTDLPNRAVFTDQLEAAVRRQDAQGAMTGVLLIDLDRFKDINDLHGHPVGDQVIRETARRLRQAVRPTDTVARLGGDEFAIIQSEIGFANQAADLAHRLLFLIAQPIDCGGGLVVRNAASIGIAICPLNGTGIGTLISRADTALYKAKSLGRGTYCVFEEGMDAAVKIRRHLEADLTMAIERDEFEIYFQPRLGAATAEILGYEALIRWHHPTRGTVSPTDFIPVAEQSGQIVPIGKWVMENACRIALSEFGGKRVSVNVSPLQFRDKGFVEAVETALARSGLPAEQLEIEITESVVFDDDQRAFGVLKALKKLNVRIALDDFGTGYSSLSYLSRFPFDVIKIDRSFVSSMPSSASACAIVETILRLGNALGMDIVAEGVETVNQLDMLVREGCDEIQGFLVGKPVPLAELLREVPAEVRETLETAHAAADGVVSLEGMAERMRDAAGKAPARATERA
ncbi:ammonium transporter [Breoghania sp. L-A4]|nr:ammonium transporter [Breoghania sp. L-A4]